jgi:hypothetical protein
MCVPVAGQDTKVCMADLLSAVPAVAKERQLFSVTENLFAEEPVRCVRAVMKDL